MRILVFSIFFLVIISAAFSDEKSNRVFVDTFLEAVRDRNTDKIADLIHYPLRRQYPLPDIYDREEMIKRFSQVFDASLMNIIENSSFENDWSAVGWRGIMLNNGLVWINYDGKISNINHRSLYETETRNNIIFEMKNNIYETLREFKDPVLFAETENHILRIDLLHDHNYRLTLWPKGKEQTEIPDLILLNGRVTFDGTMGNRHFIFYRSDEQYILYVTVYDINHGEFVIYRGNTYWLEDETNIVLRELIEAIEN